MSLPIASGSGNLTSQEGHDDANDGDYEDGVVDDDDDDKSLNQVGRAGGATVNACRQLNLISEVK